MDALSISSRGFTIDQIPARSAIGVLDAEVANEGEAALMLTDGDSVNWTPPPIKPVVPDLSEVKSLKKYFGRTGYAAWPAVLYHPNGESREVKNQAEAAKLGVVYRKATEDEHARYHVNAVWDYATDTKWRPTPYPANLAFNPAKPGTGKTYIATAPNPIIAQNALVEALIPQVAEAVARALKATNSAVPAEINKAEADEFRAFQAWKKTQQVVNDLAESAMEEPVHNALAVTAEDERAIWEKQAEDLGIKVDRRWSLTRLKAEVEKGGA